MNAIGMDINRVAEQVAALRDECSAAHDIPADIGSHYGRAADALCRAMDALTAARKEAECGAK